MREDTSVPTGRRVASPGRQEAGGTRGRDVLGVTRRSVGVTPRDNGPLVKGFKLGTLTAEDISPMAVALGLGTSYDHWFATLAPRGSHGRGPRWSLHTGVLGALRSRSRLP